MISEHKIARQLDAYNAWKHRQQHVFDQLQPWLTQQGLHTPELRQAIAGAEDCMRNDRITVAFAGEFSRGKTELINALFFADYGRRLLPTDAGRTTMCPTEIFQDDTQPPCLSLLPIDTRARDSSLADLRDDAQAWQHIPLDLATPAAIEAALGEITATQCVTPLEAAHLGLFNNHDHCGVTPDGKVTIPKWRLARINFRHPLLAQGLYILDTPGLNAVGNEPELTHEILPAAQAVVFVLGADTGVTRSDMQMWEQHLHRPGAGNQQRTLVVLNKSDVLWDELRPHERIAMSLERQRGEVARMLGVDLTQVFACSAQKALLARIEADPELEQRSNIQALEIRLADRLVHNRRDLIVADTTDRVCAELENLIELVGSRERRNQEQLDKLLQLNGQSESAIARMLEDTQQKKRRYQHSVDTYRHSHAQFQTRAAVLLESLNLSSLDEVIERARRQMSGAWTTFGLQTTMRSLFEEVHRRLDLVSNETQIMRRQVRTLYRTFQTEYAFPALQPAMFSIVRHQVEFGLLQQEAEVFRTSARTTLTEQHFVVRRYFRTLVERARRIFFKAREDARHWLRTVLDPLTLQVKEHRIGLAQQITDLKHAGRSRQTVVLRIRTLQKEAKRLQSQTLSLGAVRKRLSVAIDLPDSDGKIRPQLVAGTTLRN